MAHTLQIRNTDHHVKIRSPWAVALLPFVTLGIYHLVWWYRINREMRDYGYAKGFDLGRNPTNSLLALFPGGFIIVPPFITYWRGTKRVQASSRVGGKDALSGWIALILFLLLSPGYWAYLQVSLNDLWLAEADPLPGHAPLPDRSDGLPPRLDTAPPSSGPALAASASAAAASEPAAVASDPTAADSAFAAAASASEPAAPEGEPAAPASEPGASPGEPGSTPSDTTATEPAGPTPNEPAGASDEPAPSPTDSPQQQGPSEPAAGT